MAACRRQVERLAAIAGAQRQAVGIVVQQNDQRLGVALVRRLVDGHKAVSVGQLGVGAQPQERVYSHGLVVVDGQKKGRVALDIGLIGVARVGPLDVQHHALGIPNGGRPKQRLTGAPLFLL